MQASIYDSPHPTYRTARRVGPEGVPAATWGEVLGDRGFVRPEWLREVTLWWRDVIASRRIDLVIADDAPPALLATPAFGVPTVATGKGYGFSSSHLPEFPVIHPPPPVTAACLTKRSFWTT